MLVPVRAGTVRRDGAGAATMWRHARCGGAEAAFVARGEAGGGGRGLTATALDPAMCAAGETPAPRQTARCESRDPGAGGSVTRSVTVCVTVCVIGANGHGRRPEGLRVVMCDRWPLLSTADFCGVDDVSVLRADCAVFAERR